MRYIHNPNNVYTLFGQTLASPVVRSGNAKRDMYVDENDFSLRINTVLLEDADVYVCYVESREFGGSFAFEYLQVQGMYHRFEFSG